MSSQKTSSVSTDRTEKSVRASRPVANDSSTQRYLPFSEIRDNVIFMKDGSCRVVLRVETVNFALKSEQEQDAIILGYQRFLNSLRFPIQILVRSLKVDIEGYISKLKSLGDEQNDALLKEQTYRYIDFLANLVEVAQIMKKEFYVVVPHDENETLATKHAGLFVTFKQFWNSVFGQAVDISKIKATRARIEDMKKKVYEKSGIVRSSLEMVGLRSRALEKHELIELLMSCYNPKLGPTSRLGRTAEHVDLTDA